MWDLIVSVPDHYLSFYFEGSILPLGRIQRLQLQLYISLKIHTSYLSRWWKYRRWLRKSKHGILFKFHCVELNNVMKNVHFVWHGVTLHERCFRVSLLEK